MVSRLTYCKALRKMLCLLAVISSLGANCVLAEAQPNNSTPSQDSRSKVQSQSVFMEAQRAFAVETERAFAAHDYDRVITLMNSVVASNVDPVRASVAIMYRGNAYGAKGDLVKAMADLDEALKLNPQNAQAYRWRAVALVKTGDLDGGLRDLTEAIRFDPKSSVYFLMRAKIFAAQHNPPATLDDLNKVIELNPKDAEGYSLRATMYMRTGDNEKALAEANRAIQLDPNNVAAYSCRLNVYTRMKRYNDAEADLKTVAGLHSKEPATQWNSISWFRATCLDDRMRNANEAVSAGKKACELSGWKDYHRLDTLAAAYAEEGDFEQAVATENRALEAVTPIADETEMRKRLALYQKHEPYRDQLKP